MKIVVVTGASSGLGREFARQISVKYSRFDEIWLLARRTEPMEELSKELRIKARIISLDLSKESELEAFSSLLEEQKPEVKLLVNCAGFGKIGKVEENEYEDVKGMIDVNCRALSLITQLILPYISDNSRIINIASAAAFLPQPNFAVYAATKAYVFSYSRALRVELKPRHITVTIVCPGPVDTEFFDVAGKDIKFLKRMVMAKPEKVVSKAIKDAALGNEISIYGKLLSIGIKLSKFLPHKLLMKLFS